MEDVGGDVSTIVVRVGSDFSREVAKMTNESIKQLLLFLIEKAKEQSDKAGETVLRKLVKSNDEIKMFDLEQKQLKAFNELAKKYEISYAVVEDQKQFSVFYKQSDESRIKSILEKIIENGLNKRDDNIPITKLHDIEQERSGLKLIKQKLFTEDHEEVETAEDSKKLNPDEIKQLTGKREDVKTPYEVADPKGNIETTLVIDHNGKFERIEKDQLDGRIKKILENMKDNQKHQFDVGINGKRIGVERQENVFVFRAEHGHENGRTTLAKKLGHPENAVPNERRGRGERMSLAEKREEIKPLVEAQKQAPPVENKNRDRGGR